MSMVASMMRMTRELVRCNMGCMREVMAEEDIDVACLESYAFVGVGSGH